MPHYASQLMSFNVTLRAIAYSLLVAACFVYLLPGALYRCYRPCFGYSNISYAARLQYNGHRVTWSLPVYRYALGGSFDVVYTHRRHWHERLLSVKRYSTNAG
jgi:hypothetical protein